MTPTDRKELTRAIVEAADYLAALNDSDPEFWDAVSQLRERVWEAQKSAGNEWVVQGLAL